MNVTFTNCPLLKTTYMFLLHMGINYSCSSHKDSYDLLLSEYSCEGICADQELVKHFEMFWSERHCINKCSISFLIYLTIFVLGFDLWKLHCFTRLDSSDYLDMNEDLLEIV